ncbi:MAG: hypothetical protein CM15mP30_0800 [Pelagibacteraceae bacterium]|nr:MAG: hypothetical protein CM15mP30_0800 [Pelagibacteraceae bacterium]
METIQLRSLFKATQVRRLSLKKFSERLKKVDQTTRKENFLLMAPILSDILTLHDIIRDEFMIMQKKFTKKDDKGYYVLNGKDSKGKK